MLLRSLLSNIDFANVAGFIITLGSLLGAVSAIYLFIRRIRKKIATDVNKEENIDSLIGSKEEFENKLKEFSDSIAELKRYVESIDKKVDSIEDRLINLEKNFNEHVEQNTLQTHLLVEEARIVLLNEMETSIKKGWASIEQKRRIGDLYHWYGKNGGNHGVGDIFEIFKELPSQEKADKED